MHLRLNPTSPVVLPGKWNENTVADTAAGERERYHLDIWQQFGDDGVGHFVHGVQSGDDGGGVKGENHSELGATLRMFRISLERRRKAVNTGSVPQGSMSEPLLFDQPDIKTSLRIKNAPIKRSGF